MSSLSLSLSVYTVHCAPGRRGALRCMPPPPERAQRRLPRPVPEWAPIAPDTHRACERCLWRGPSTTPSATLLFPHRSPTAVMAHTPSTVARSACLVVSRNHSIPVSAHSSLEPRLPIRPSTAPSHVIARRARSTLTAQFLLACRVRPFVLCAVFGVDGASVRSLSLSLTHSLKMS